MSRILIADDDKAMLAMVSRVLDDEGYTVTTARAIEEVLEYVEQEPPDLLLLDLALSNVEDGISLCRKLRANSRTADMPIIFLTGHRDIQSAVQALEAGGDDYVRKPFVIRELTARIRAHLRRAPAGDQTNTVDLRINPETYQAYVNDREILLTRIEFDLLLFMCRNAHRWHSTHDLLTGVWNYPSGVGDTALVRNHIRNLRRKLEINPDYPAIIQSRHGRGYSIQAQVTVQESPYINRR
jgi:DNA-binding response OmpR family regulator